MYTQDGNGSLLNVGTPTAGSPTGNVTDFTQNAEGSNLAFTVPWAIVISIVLFFVCAATIFGNSLVIVSFLRDSSIRQKYDNWFIFNLSIADFFVGCISLPLNSIWVVVGYWPFGKGACQFFLFTDYIVCYMSVVAMTCITLDRYWLVTMELRYFRFQSLGRVSIMIGTSWAIVAIFYSITVFKWTIWVDEGWVDYSQECELEAIDSVVFNTISFVIEFIIPFSIIVGCNLVIYINIRRRSRGQVSNAQVEYTSKNGVKPSNTRLLTKHRRAAKNLTILVAAFLICRLPFYIVSIISAICDDCVENTIWEVVNYILWCNSTINPLIYAITKPVFKSNFKKLLCCCCKRYNMHVPSIQSSNHQE
ncbi:histamine H3 receptor-like [Anneissia japonica]|uniref:histamine H3 receptor-like n=1 Tax=Anneissia japonica TaxID=1529436 RepID=UPI001425519F|nr:histamine H3 receptor-like [Anneissia japonica]XP_033115416.1 histamine H3 receptor-like [Anneissia japonica]XP_033115419.1 histamine H3 receptor-like [Anneissia japonica]XP_033115420.1 histamine H3 receptor-like [Anneissia japonica]XP_033115421.1 histamine H3 receptor-like [Anneissia japonica]